MRAVRVLKTFNNEAGDTTNPLRPQCCTVLGAFFWSQHMKPTHAQVTQVSAYRTNDGELFATAKEANAHAAKLNFVDWYRRGNELVKEGDVYLNGHHVADWLTDNRTAVLELLLSYEPKEPRYAV